MVTSRASTAAIRVLRGASCGSPSCTTRHAFNSAQDATLFGSWLLLDHFDSLVSRRPDYDPHPHAGMATLTYLFDGRLVHRDSIGTEQVIEANGLSWFHAGAAACTRSPPSARSRAKRGCTVSSWGRAAEAERARSAGVCVSSAAGAPSVVIRARACGWCWAKASAPVHPWSPRLRCRCSISASPAAPPSRCPHLGMPITSARSTW
ncbi:MAG: pirin family protein [Myxococcales bacterium]|nr:pirin family protein [Myxococcales bacterium]